MKSVPSIQRFTSRKEWEKYVWKKIMSKLAKATSSEIVEKSFAMLVTAHEKKQIIKRVVAVSLLKQRKTYREIEEMLWLSPTTISALRKSMCEGGEYISPRIRGKKSATTKKLSYGKNRSRLGPKVWFEALFELPPPPPVRDSARRRTNVTKPHGKLVFAQRHR